jgi:hypothetical protein
VCKGYECVRGKSVLGVRACKDYECVRVMSVLGVRAC